MRARLWRRLAGSTPGTSLAIVLMVALTAGLLTAWPRLLGQVLLDEVTHRIEATAPTVRALTAQVLGWPDTSPDGRRRSGPSWTDSPPRPAPSSGTASGSRCWSWRPPAWFRSSAPTGLTTSPPGT